MEETAKKVSEALIKGNAPLVKELVSSCLERGLDPRVVLEQGLIAGMAVIGTRFKNDEIFLPEVMIAARAMKAGLEVLDPVLGDSGAQFKGTMVLGTVRDDLHDVGKNLVAMMFRGAGFRVVDLGIDVPEQRFVESIREHQPQIVGMSALLTMTLPAMKSTIAAIEESGLRREAIIMVGGAPVTLEFSQEIGADGWAPDAASAVDKALELMNERFGEHKE